MVPQQSLKPDHKDELLNVLADAKRRAILVYLRESPSDVATVPMLVDALNSADHLDSETTAVALVHTHLPTLDGAGLIEFDQRSQTARYHAPPSVEQLLDTISNL